MIKTPSFTQIVPHILNSCVKKGTATIILRMSTTLPCLRYQIIKVANLRISINLGFLWISHYMNLQSKYRHTKDMILSIMMISVGPNTIVGKGALINDYRVH